MQFVQRILAGMAKRGMPEIVGQRDRFGEILVKSKHTADAPCNLGNFDAMGKARTEQVAFMVYEYLRFVFEPAKSSGVDDAIAVTLEFSTHRRRRLCMATPARGRVRCRHTERAQALGNRDSHSDESASSLASSLTTACPILLQQDEAQAAILYFLVVTHQLEVAIDGDWGARDWQLSPQQQVLDTMYICIIKPALQP